jgi:Caspase domain
MARKFALIIGNSQYEDAQLSKLAAPDVDARALAEILETPDIGGFDEVLPVLNEGLASVRKAIARFFDLRHRDDLLVMYFSGHGVRDEQGHLYLAVRDTERAVLAGTAIEASYVTARMDRSASKRLVLVLDCCHSGAFGYGTKAAHGASVGTATAFEGTGRGRVVLTATDATQYAWEGDQIIGDVENSLFTHYLIEGMRTGAADRDEDGKITIDELYEYVYDRVLHETPKQTPGKWAFGQQGEIIIARNRRLASAKLPLELEESLGSRFPSVRLEAVEELGKIVRGRHEVRAQAARDALKRLTEDDSRRVAGAAIDILKAVEQGVEGELRVTPQDQTAETAKQLTAEAEAQEQRIASRLSTAQSALDRGALEEAGTALAEVLQLDPQQAEALKVQERLQRAIGERTRLEEAEQRIRAMRQRIATLIAQANAAGPHQDAIALLNEALGLDPEHAEVKELLEERHRLQAEGEAERRAREAEDRKRREVDGHLSEASRHRDRKNLTKAIVLTEAVLKLDPEHSGAQLLHTELKQAVEEKKESERRAAEERERLRQLEDMIATAEAAPTPDTAVGILRDVLARDPGNGKAKRVLNKRLAELEEARLEERQQKIAAAQEQIEELLARNDLDGCNSALESAERELQSPEDFSSLRDRLVSRRRDEELERLAKAAVQKANDSFEQGQHQHAIAELAAFAPPHALVTETLRTLKAEAEKIRRAKREEEERGRAEAERLAREERAAELMASAGVAIEEKRFHEAQQTLAEVRSLTPTAQGLPVLEQAARDGLAAEAAAEQAQREIDQALAKAAKRLQRRDYAGATQHVEDALARDGQYPAALALRSEIERVSQDPTAQPAGFSLRPTLSTAAVWLKSTVLRSSTFKVGGSIVLALIAAIILWRPEAGGRGPEAGGRGPGAGGLESGARVPEAGGRGPAAAAGSVSEPKVPSPEPPASAPATPANPLPDPVSVPTAAPEAASATPAARDERLAGAEKRARQQLGAGDTENALKTARWGLGIDATDTGLQAVLNDILRDAQADTARSAEAALRAGKPAVASKDFETATRLRAEADGFRDAGRKEFAARRYIDADRLFERAALTPSVTAANAPPPVVAERPAPVNPPVPQRSEAPSSTTGEKPATTAAPSPAPSGAAAAAITLAAIDRTLREYESALEKRSVDALKNVWPGMPRDVEQKLRVSLGGYKSLAIELNCSGPVIGSATASITCRELNRIVSNVGGGYEQEEFVTHFSFRAAGSGWVITDVRWRTPR